MKVVAFLIWVFSYAAAVVLLKSWPSSFLEITAHTFCCLLVGFYGLFQRELTKYAMRVHPLQTLISASLVGGFFITLFTTLIHAASSILLFAIPENSYFPFIYADILLASVALSTRVGIAAVIATILCHWFACPPVSRYDPFFMRLLSFITALGFSSASLAEEIVPIPRSEWAGKPRIESKFEEHSAGIKEIILHHSGASVHLDGDPKARINNSIRSWHMEAEGGGGWGDVAYHFLIDQKGRVYEGRPEHARGRSFTSYDLDGKLLICVLGDYRTLDERLLGIRQALGRELTETEKTKVESDARKYPQKLSSDSKASLTKLVIQKAKEWKVSPQAIRTHRQVAASSCPGENFQQWFEAEGHPAIQERLR